MPRAKSLKPDIPESQVQAAVIAAFAMFAIEMDRQNTGGMPNPKGRYVAFGKKGNSDLTGMLTAGIGRGRKVDCEVKNPGFNPRKVRGETAIRWAKQIARLRRTNEQGGYGFWVTDASHVVHVMTRINEGWRVVIGEDEFPYMTNEGVEEWLTASKP